MDNLALLSLIFVSVFDRAGIPVAFVSGLILLGENSTNLLYFYILASLAGLCGDILMYLLGLYLANKKENNYLTKNAGLVGLVVAKTSFILNNPIIWIYGCKVFNYINQFIPIILGIKKFSPGKFLLNSTIANFLWFGVFYLLSFPYLFILAKHGKTLGIISGIIGLAVMWYGIKKWENYNKQKYNLK
jgi:membrane protein DedA with SNARE-associated domain